MNQGGWLARLGGGGGGAFEIVAENWWLLNTDWWLLNTDWWLLNTDWWLNWGIIFSKGGGGGRAKRGGKGGAWSMQKWREI